MSKFNIGDKVKHNAYPGVIFKVTGPAYTVANYLGYGCEIVVGGAIAYAVGEKFVHLWEHLLSKVDDLSVRTTGIVACKDAHRKGFRVQCWRGQHKRWDTLSNPQFDSQDAAYRVHPEDVPKYVAWYNGEHLAPITPPQPASTARPHAELIKAWADGARIQVCMSTGKWVYVQRPSWHCDIQYRIEINAQPKIPRAVFDKGAARRKDKYNARINKLLDQITALHEQKAALAEHYVEKQRRAGVFAKEYVE